VLVMCHNKLLYYMLVCGPRHPSMRPKMVIPWRNLVRHSIPLRSGERWGEAHRASKWSTSRHPRRRAMSR